MPSPAPRPRRKGLTDKQLNAIRRRSKRFIVSDPELRGHHVRVPPEGPISFVAVTRDPYGKQIWATLGTTAELNIEQARDRAREAMRRVKQGKPAFEPPRPKPESVESVAANWLQRHVAKNGLRTAKEMRRVIEKYVLPYWRDRDFVEIKRSDVAMLLDQIEDENGPRMADVVLTVLRSIASWMQQRSDDYSSPFHRIKLRQQYGTRARVLDDDELRAVWRAASEAGAFGGFVKLLLLTGQRRGKVSTMRWGDIDAAGVWTIATEPREKGNAGVLQLPQEALAVLASVPRFAGNDFVFAGRDDKPIAVHKLKEKFDTACGVGGWTLHDLRRTARSLMSRAGVLSEHAERVLGHVIGGVEGVYDRHPYFAEKADALRKLAALIERITNPPAGDNVVALHEAVS
jgi:integrase